MAAMLLPTVKAGAQQLRQAGNGRTLLQKVEAEAKTTPADLHRQMAEFKASHPLLFKARILMPNNESGLRDVVAQHVVRPSFKTHATAANTLSPVLKSQGVKLGRELWANVLQSSRWYEGDASYGIYSFGVGSMMEANEIYTSPYMYANAGGCLNGDRLDIITYNSSVGTMSHYVFNAKTGDFENGSYLSDYSLWSSETAVAADGKVYGTFYSADASRYELGVVNYASDSRTTIGQVNHYYVALGITSDNTLYGVATDGNLYRIDASTAKETLVGATGINLTLDDGSWNVQSGEIDQASGVFYWACTDSNNLSALYSVDLSTGRATKIGDMANGEQMALLTVPAETVKDAAPAVASNLALAFDKASLTGSVTFVMPTTTYGGDRLSGQLNYTLSVDGSAVKTGSAAAGSTVSEQVTTKRGNHNVAVVVSNASGDGPKAYTTRFIGDDTPLAPTNVKASLDVATGKVKLAWNAVAKGVNNGYVANMTYSVTRYPDAKTVATNTTATTADDVLPSGKLTGYYYKVTAKSGTRTSEEATSNSVSYGDMLEPPFTEGFDDESSLSVFTVIDANNDGQTWSFCSDDGSGQSSVQISYSSTVDHDDWLITPPLKLKAGTIYNISYRVASKGASYPELLEVNYGDKPTAEAMTGVLVDKTEITNQQYITVKKELTPEKDGVYYFGFHCTSDHDWCYQLVLDDISVTGNSQKAPEAITDLNVVPSTDGTNFATVNFTTPSKAIDGSALSSDLEVSILRDGEEIQEMAALKPGTAYYYKDREPKTGFNTYKVVAKNSEGTGRESKEVQVYVGLDTPHEPANIQYKVADKSITLTWDSVTTGSNGGYVDPSDITYNVYELEETSTGVNLPFLDNVSEPTITVPYDVNSGSQEMINYVLGAENSLGEGPRVLSPGIIVGAPYTLPFEEHFKGGALDHAMWWISKSGSSAFDLMQGLSADGDGGCAGYVSTADGDNATLGSGKLALSGATNPTLVFSNMSTAAKAGAKVVVYIHKPDQTSEQLCTVDFSKLDNSAKDWKTTSVKIGREYVSLPYVTLTFVTTAPQGETVYFDNIYVRDVVAKDLRATISAPASVRKGEPVTAKVGITNMGSAEVKSYTVKFYAGNKLVDTKTYDETLAPYASATKQLVYKTTMADANPLTLKAEIVADGDATPDDNVATTDVVLLASTKTAPASVTATTADKLSVDVAWTKVNETSETVTDDFESYTAWDMDEFGDWTAAYGEKGLAKGPFSKTYPHPNEGKRFAYTLVETSTWLTSDVTDMYPSVKPHSGDHYLAAFYSVENSKFIVADNWLVSPSLTGEKQTITFWANNFVSAALNYPETFEVLYSTTGASLDDFKSTGKTFTVSDGNWTKYSVELPEGSTYFAIHNNTDDTYMFMLDDITYRAGCGKVVAYNIYRDGELIKQVSADTDSFTDTTAEGGTHRYGVSAVYAGGESEMTLASPVTAIDAVAADGNVAPGDVYTIDGKLVRKNASSLKGLAPGVYVVGGKAVTVR